MGTLAPIALFIYRRPEHTARALATLSACPEFERSPLHVYCDAAKTPDVRHAVTEARRAARQLAPRSAVFVERDSNYGLARSIIAGTDEIVARYGKVIVVEDDLEVAPSFLRFLNAGLDRFADNDRVMQVSGYQFPVEVPPRPLFMALPTSLGWGTWARAWAHFDPHAAGFAMLRADRGLRRRFDLDGAYPYYELLEQQLRGEVDSWAIRWYLSVFLRNGLTLYPERNLVRHTGVDGTHGGPSYVRQALDSADVSVDMPDVAVDAVAQRRVFAFLAEDTARTRGGRVRRLAMKWGRAVLDSTVLPARLRVVGANLRARVARGSASPRSQDLDVYWDPKMAEMLEHWGEGNAWNEIQLLLANLRGKVIDIACGTGKVMSILADYPALELHGCDISDLMIGRAIERGIPRERLRVADATATPYADGEFDYGYSIGSLEHFTEDGIARFVAEAKRITRRASFHQIPTSRSGRNEGWIKRQQSYHNNSIEWWLRFYRGSYTTVHVLDSAWNDKISVGKWFVCIGEGA